MRFTAMITVVAAGVLAGPAGAVAGPGDALATFERTSEKVSDATLARMRGGLDAADLNGIQRVGLKIEGSIDGPALDQKIEFRLERNLLEDTEDGLVVPDEASGEIVGGDFVVSPGVADAESGEDLAAEDNPVIVQLKETDRAIRTAVQTGRGSAVDSDLAAGARGLVTTVQNNLDDIRIDIDNTVEVDTVQGFTSADRRRIVEAVERARF